MNLHALTLTQRSTRFTHGKIQEECPNAEERSICESKTTPHEKEFKLRQRSHTSRIVRHAQTTPSPLLSFPRINKRPPTPPPSPHAPFTAPNVRHGRRSQNAEPASSLRRRVTNPPSPHTALFIAMRMRIVLINIWATCTKWGMVGCGS